MCKFTYSVFYLLPFHFKSWIGFFKNCQLKIVNKSLKRVREPVCSQAYEYYKYLFIILLFLKGTWHNISNLSHQLLSLETMCTYVVQVMQVYLKLVLQLVLSVCQTLYYQTEVHCIGNSSKWVLPSLWAQVVSLVLLNPMQHGLHYLSHNLISI